MTATLNRVAALAGAALLLLACGQPLGSLGPTPAPTALPPGELLWPAPPDPLQLAVTAGLKPEKRETLTFHVHAHLDVFVDGARVIVPAGLGINILDPGVKKFDYVGTAAYGGIAGCSQPCISPLHTHDQSGVIHTESSNPTPHRLGQFFTEWGVPLTPTCVGQYCRPATAVVIYVNGQRHSGDPTAIQLTARLEIAIIIGAAPPHIPAVFPPDAPG